MLWRSVVGKLWMTILLLVSFVLGFVAILLSQFFRTYYVDMSEARLQKVATSVSELIEEGADVKTIENIAYKFSDPLSHYSSFSLNSFELFQNLPLAVYQCHIIFVSLKN